MPKLAPSKQSHIAMPTCCPAGSSPALPPAATCSAGRLPLLLPATAECATAAASEHSCPRVAGSSPWASSLRCSSFAASCFCCICRAWIASAPLTAPLLLLLLELPLPLSPWSPPLSVHASALLPLALLLLGSPRSSLSRRLMSLQGRGAWRGCKLAQGGNPPQVLGPAISLGGAPPPACLAHHYILYVPSLESAAGGGVLAGSTHTPAPLQ